MSCKYNEVYIKKVLRNIFDKIESDLEFIISSLKYSNVTHCVLEFLLGNIDSYKTKDSEVYEIILNITENIEIQGLVLSPDCKKDEKKFNSKNLKKMFGKLWRKLLKSTIPETILTQMMISLGDSILSKISCTLLADDLITTFERNHNLGVAGLKAICYLMRKEQIEYLGVYDVIMNLLDERLFSSIHINRFFDDLDLFLSSRSLEHQKAAEFAKRLAELALSSATICHLPMLLKMIINILKRYQQSQSLLKIDAADLQTGEKNIKLTELKTLQYHFDPEIRKLVEEINYELNDKEDCMIPSTCVKLKEKKCKMSLETIKSAVNFLIESNSSLPQLPTIEYFGTLSMNLLE